MADRKKRKRAYTSKRQFNFPSRLEHIILYTLGGVDSRKAPHVNGLSIVGGWGDASGQGGDVTEGSDFNLVFFGCPLNVATHMGDRAVQIHENAQKARNDQAPKAPGRFSLFRHFREYEPPGLPYGWTRLVGNQKKREKTKFIL